MQGMRAPAIFLALALAAPAAAQTRWFMRGSDTVPGDRPGYNPDILLNNDLQVMLRRDLAAPGVRPYRALLSTYGVGSRDLLRQQFSYQVRNGAQLNQFLYGTPPSEFAGVSRSRFLRSRSAAPPAAPGTTGRVGAMLHSPRGLRSGPAGRAPSPPGQPGTGTAQGAQSLSFPVGGEAGTSPAGWEDPAPPDPGAGIAEELSAALEALRAAWHSGDPALLGPRFPADGRVGIFADGRQVGEEPAAEVAALFAGAVSRLRTLVFEFDPVPSRPGPVVVATARHAFLHPSGRETRVFVSYGLRRQDDEWKVVEVGTSSRPILGHQRPEQAPAAGPRMQP